MLWQDPHFEIKPQSLPERDKPAITLLA